MAENQPEARGLLSQITQGLGGAGDSLLDFANSQEGQIALGLLSAGGASSAPGGPGTRIGPAIQNVLNQQSRRGLFDAQAQNQLEQARGGGPNSNTNVQSTFQGQNGNMWFIRRNGDRVDTGVPFNTNVQLIEQADGSVVAVDKSTGTVLGTPVSSEEGQSAKTKEQIRKDQTEKAITLPADLAKLDSIITVTNETIGKIDKILPLVRPNTVGAEVLRAKFPGVLGGDVRTLAKAIESLQANFGFDTLQKMRAASASGGALGQVSERELSLLINALQAIDQGGDPDVLRENLEAVKTHYNNYISEIEKMKGIMRERAGQSAPDTDANIVDFNDLPQ